jgi:hypothetical protein
MVERMAEKRLPKVLEEFRHVFPEAYTKFYVDGEGRGVIKILTDDYLVGMEFIETDDSWSDRKRIWEYYVALVNKCRLVLFVPKEHAVQARLRMLEFNNYWMNYYMVFSYDEGLQTEKVARVKIHPNMPLLSPSNPLGGYL